MSFCIAVFFENKYSLDDLNHFPEILEEAFTHVSMNSARPWKSDGLDEPIVEFKENNCVDFIGPHYYIVTFNQSLLCVSPLARTRTLAGEYCTEGLLDEINLVCKNLGAERVVYTDDFDFVLEAAEENDFEGLIQFLSEQFTEHGHGTITELANVDCSYCILDI